MKSKWTISRLTHFSLAFSAIGAGTGAHVNNLPSE